MPTAELTLDGLVAAVAAELDHRDITPTDPRAAERPDARTLRYYTTLGLLDPPLGHRDRRAVYGKRHVRQAVAIKRLQARGASLAEIQTEIAGLDDHALDDVAATADADVLARTRGRRREKFWSAAPSDAPPSAALSTALPSPTSLVTGFDITPDVTLLVRGDAAWLDDPEVRRAAHALGASIAAARTRGPATRREHS